MLNCGPWHPGAIIVNPLCHNPSSLYNGFIIPHHLPSPSITLHHPSITFHRHPSPSLTILHPPSRSITLPRVPLPSGSSLSHSNIPDHPMLQGKIPGSFFSYICDVNLLRLIRKRYISFILLMCFAVIPAHNMIPHHHHDGVPASEEGTSCPFNQPGHGQQQDHKKGQENEHDKEKGHPVHCHAFNEISFYKNVLPGVSQPSELPVLYANHPSPEDTARANCVVKSITITGAVPLHSRHCGNQVSLRGPPSVV